MKKRIIILIFFAIIKTADAATYYVCDTGTACGSGWTTGLDSNSCSAAQSKATPKKTINSGIACLSSGSTLIVGDGTYTDSGNMISTTSTLIPSGSSSTALTIVKAEHDGGATIDGQGSRTPIAIVGNLTIEGRNNGGALGPQAYIELRGFVAKSSSGSVVNIYYTDHVKLTNIGAYDAADGNNMVIDIGPSYYTVVEGCYAWGNGRYKFSTWHAFHSIFRNNVARFDRANASGDPESTFVIYSSGNVEVQNCIAVDGDQPQFWLNASEYGGSFANPTTTTVATANRGPINYNNVIAINNATRFASSDANTYPADVYFNNCVGWDARARGANGFINSPGIMNINHCTFGTVPTPAGGSLDSNTNFNGWGSQSQAITNSIIYNFSGGLFYNWESGNFNDINTTGTINVNGSANILDTRIYSPLTNGLLYPVRIETGSVLDTAGQGGTYIGAKIVKQYGKSGTFWGEAGYNLLQDGTNGQADVDLWPFPKENLIRMKMAAYSYTGPDNTGATRTLSGARGFCANGQSLTNYIWSYLGNSSPLPKRPAPPTGLTVR